MANSKDLLDNETDELETNVASTSTGQTPTGQVGETIKKEAKSPQKISKKRKGNNSNTTMPVTRRSKRLKLSAREQKKSEATSSFSKTNVTPKTSSKDSSVGNGTGPKVTVVSKPKGVTNFTASNVKSTGKTDSSSPKSNQQNSSYVDIHLPLQISDLV